MSTKIEWTDETWNPVTGCGHVSPGCDNCYAERVAKRFGRPFIGAVECHPDRLDKPLHWRRPRRVFVNSVSDLFHPDVPDAFIVDVFAVMAAAAEHTFQVLTKRPQRMAALLGSDAFADEVESASGFYTHATLEPPLPNVWLGVSVENQRYADLRIPYLLAAPAAVRFLSVEPLLDAVSLDRYLVEVTKCPTCEGRRSVPVPGGGTACPDCFDDPNGQGAHTTRLIDWVIVGGESGPKARPMLVEWPIALRDQCAATGVPFFFKQWGRQYPGRELQGRTWDEYPDVGRAPETAP